MVEAGLLINPSDLNSVVESSVLFDNFLTFFLFCLELDLDCGTYGIGKPNLSKGTLVLPDCSNN